MYGNHTNPLCDTYYPCFVNGYKDVYLICNPENVSVPVLGPITPSLGALPLPGDMEATKNFTKAIEYHINHDIINMQSDTGVKHKSKATTIYVELDKCLQQLRLHQNAENPNNTPDELQIMLAMIANINDDIVKEYMAEYPTLKKIYEEIVVFSQDKEVQGMIIEEMLRENDYYSGINEAKAEAKVEGRSELIAELIADGKITPDEAKHYAPVPSEKNK